MHLGHLQGKWRQALDLPLSPSHLKVIKDFIYIGLQKKIRLCTSPPTRTRDMKEPDDLQIFSLQPVFQPPPEELVSVTSNHLSTPVLILG